MSRIKKTAPVDVERPPLPFERPWVIRSLNLALYVTNFILVHYAWERVSPGKGDLVRLGVCWFLSYILTRIMIEVTKVPARAFLTIALSALLIFVLFF